MSINDQNPPHSTPDEGKKAETPEIKIDEDVLAEAGIDRREAMQAIAKYSAAVSSAAVVVLSSKDALSLGDTSGICGGGSPPPFCP